MPASANARATFAPAPPARALMPSINRAVPGAGRSSTGVISRSTWTQPMTVADTSSRHLRIRLLAPQRSDGEAEPRCQMRDDELDGDDLEDRPDRLGAPGRDQCAHPRRPTDRLVGHDRHAGAIGDERAREAELPAGAEHDAAEPPPDGLQRAVQVLP